MTLYLRKNVISLEKASQLQEAVETIVAQNKNIRRTDVARKRRFNLPNFTQHIVQRGNNCQPCFSSEQDYQFCLANLREAAAKNQVEIYAYVLMTNHVHILVTPRQANSVSFMMQDLGRKYVRYFNKTKQLTDTLWEGRYKACLVDSDAYLLACMRDIEMNPVRTNMVQSPSNYD